MPLTSLILSLRLLDHTWPLLGHTRPLDHSQESLLVVLLVDGTLLTAMKRHDAV